MASPTSSSSRGGLGGGGSISVVRTPSFFQNEPSFFSYFISDKSKLFFIVFPRLPVIQ